jgi:hypothetical protein
VLLEGVCRVHQQFPSSELRVLLKRGVGAVAPLQRLDIRIEYRRADGTEYGVDDDGSVYEVRGR